MNEDDDANNGTDSDETLIVVAEEETGPRLDKFLTDQLQHLGLSRSRIQALVKNGDIKVDGALVKPRLAIDAGMQITVHIPTAEPVEPQPEDIPLTILHEDDGILVLDKAHGMVVHPAAGNLDGTLVNALLHHCGASLSSIGGPDRPGIVHRLDKDTSGCMVVAKNDAAHTSLVSQFSERTTSKIYLAAVERSLYPNTGRLETHIARDSHNRLRMAVVQPPAGKVAITEYEVIGSHSGSDLIQCRILTGRTHQIRVHLRHLGHPILGDPIYAHPKRQTPRTRRLMLHARELSIDHPVTGERMRFDAPVPDDFQPWLDTPRSDQDVPQF